MADLAPIEWLSLLGQRLLDRRKYVHKWQRYYDGNQDMPTGPQQHKDAYRRFQKYARTNLCKLAVDSMVHRMKVIGYRTGDEDRANNDIWRLWQGARLDSRQFGLYRSALTTGAAFAVVGPDPRDLSVPRVTIESARNVIVATDPADPTIRLAALRLWHDPYERRWFATLYLPGQRIGYRTRKQHVQDTSTEMIDWTVTGWEQRFSERSFEVVPVIEFSNSHEGEEPRAEFDAGMDVQDRLNLTVLNRLTAERYAAFRQRFLLNYEVDYDEETGLPIPPFNPGVDQTFTIPPPLPGMPEPKFGDLVQTDTSQMLRAVEADMRVFAAITITPVYYLPGDLINISAEGIAALDAGHTSKIAEQSSAWSESHEEMLALMAEIAGVRTGDLTDAEIVWQRPENFDLASIAKYAQGFATAGYPLPYIAERLGESPQEIDRLRTELTSEAFRQSLAAPDQTNQSNGSQTRSQGQESASER